MRAQKLLYVFARRYQMISACMTVSVRELRTAVREWACCTSFMLIARTTKYRETIQVSTLLTLRRYQCVYMALRLYTEIQKY